VTPRVTTSTRARNTAVFIVLALAVGWMGAPGVLAQSARPIHAIDVTGVINSLTARYLERALAEAEQAGAELLVMRLDTPGGLDTAMREMTQAMLAARVPVAVYVAPSGARAASAGMFLTLAAHVAAMAPGTNIGAAHPVSLGEQLDAVASEKAAQDAAATARTLALQRGRSAEWAEKAVLESVSLTSAEALDRGLIDIIAVDMNDLLAQLDGRAVTTAAGSVTLHTRGALVVDAPMNFAERLLHVITDPNIAYLLLTLGLYALLIEFQAPGFGLPGTVGVIALVLAFVAFGSLPLNWAGLGLIALGVILLIVEALSPGFGAAGVAGLIMFALGSLMLYQPIDPAAPTLPAVMVNPWLVALITTGTGAMILVAVRKAIQAQRAPAASDVPRRLVGLSGPVKTDLNPIGTAQIGSELWSAVAAGGEPIRAGEVVEVVAVDGLTLRVRRVEIPSHSSSGGSHV
jgi:membrane-bound serine protease (ClpP class)